MRKVVPVVAAAIHSNIDYNKFLIVKRDTPINGETFLRYELPGGKVEEGEELEQALAREIQEELNLEISVDRVIHAQLNKYTHTDYTYLVIFFECFSVCDFDEESIPNSLWVEWKDIGVKIPVLPGLLEALEAA